MSRRTQIGCVISHKMQKTAIVVVARRTPELRTGKVVLQQKKYQVHDEKDETQAGDEVLIEESRPLSREKRWRIRKVLKKSYAEAGGEA